MRIALNFPGCYRKGGVERVMLECANFLADQGHDVHVYASTWEPGTLRPTVTQHDVDTGRWPGLSKLVGFGLAVRRQLRQLDPPADVVAGFGVLCPSGGVLWVCSVQRAWLDTSQRQRNFLGRWKQRVNPFHPLILLMERHHYRGRRYQKLIALTDEVKRELIRFYGVPPGDIVIIPNGFAPAEFSVARMAELREPMRRKLGYSAGDRVVIFVANELERKGFGPLLRAIAQLNDPTVKLLAVGRLNPTAYAAEAERLGMTGRLQYVGSTSDVATFYAAADVFAMPTQHEAWGLVITEALACGLPVVTSRLAGASVSVHEGLAGDLLEDPNDVGEITTKLRKVLQGQHGSAAAIAESVAPYAWGPVLGHFEALLAQYGSGRNRTGTLAGATLASG
jgi:UDP-glucose:(heptosyl)LPS alpha-1,3-glucosyltransferase